MPTASPKALHPAALFAGETGSKHTETCAAKRCRSCAENSSSPRARIDEPLGKRRGRGGGDAGRTRTEPWSRLEPCRARRWRTGAGTGIVTGARSVDPPGCPHPDVGNPRCHRVHDSSTESRWLSGGCQPGGSSAPGRRAEHSVCSAGSIPGLPRGST